ncbi:hypothetical protein Tsp_11693 [Trichinella spiralis]|uniref:hypothetical protein n=1 Tax=Trichinella spiralis TaxID=6334 RepID=UPI0001EFE501|nr:hypothetical protein Tsp_11693 [Trichinella spiralis]
MQTITVIEDEQTKSQGDPAARYVYVINLLQLFFCRSSGARLFQNHGPNSWIIDACSSTTVYIEGQKWGLHVACRVVVSGFAVLRKPPDAQSRFDLGRASSTYMNGRSNAV